MRFLQYIFIALLVLLLAGCTDNKEKAQIADSTTLASNQNAKNIDKRGLEKDPEAWHAKLESAYKKTSVEDKGEGIVEFFACFKSNSTDCSHYAFASRDGFRKIRIFMSGFYSQLANQLELNSYLISYVSVPDYKEPLVFFAPIFLSSKGWLFMDNFALMVDGEVIIEQTFDQGVVKREVLDSRREVKERVDFTLSENQIKSLRKIKTDSKVLIRYTGEKGYTTLHKEDTEHIKKELINVLFIYDAISSKASLDKISS